MSDYIVALPVGASGIDPALDTFTRTGIDGAEVIMPIFGGDNFVGEVLAGKWIKNSDGVIVTPVSKIVSNELSVSGKAAVAGNYDWSWLYCKSMMPLLTDTSLITQLTAPAAVTAGRTVYFMFYLSATYPSADPQDENDWLRIEVRNTDGTYQWRVKKRVSGGAPTDVIALTVTTNPNCVIKLVFHDGHTHIYVDDGETGTFTEHASSPFELGLGFTEAYPCYSLQTDDSTTRTATSDYVTVSYPSLEVKYELAAANECLGACRCFDTMGSADEADWLQVYDIDHTFTGDCVIQNGLIRLFCDNLISAGVSLYLNVSGSWVYASYLAPTTNQDAVNHAVTYPHFQKLLSVNSEKVSIQVIMQDSAVDNLDYYGKFNFSLSRSSLFVELDLLDIGDATYLYLGVYNSAATRFSYASDAETHGIGDDDLTISANNTTMTDNFIASIPDAEQLFIPITFTTQKPSDRMQAYEYHGNAYLQHYYPADLPVKMGVGACLFANWDSLFTEAEDETIVANERLNFDGNGEDTVTENNGVWAALLGITSIDENNAVHNQVGSACVDILSDGSSWAVAECTPASPIGKLTKFDKIKVWAEHGSSSKSIYVYLVSTGGTGNKRIYKAIPITTTPTQYVVDLPHSASDLQGWTNDGFDFATFYKLRIGWDDGGNPEHVYVDGAHFWIGTTTTRGRGETLSNGSAVVLDAGEYILWKADPIDLPVGRYLVIVRAKDTDQVAGDFRLSGYNNTDAKFTNEENDHFTKTCTSTFAYYQFIFDIKQSDVGDEVYKIWIRKNFAGSENTIFIDHFLIIPIGNGESWPQDVAHNALRSIVKARRVFERS